MTSAVGDLGDGDHHRPQVLVNRGGSLVSKQTRLGGRRVRVDLANVEAAVADERNAKTTLGQIAARCKVSTRTLRRFLAGLPVSGRSLDRILSGLELRASDVLTYIPEDAS